MNPACDDFAWADNKPMVYVEDVDDEEEPTELLVVTAWRAK